ncbi:MAG TPA: c-type cytochrome [Hyphomicrobium sp.]|nr:c-type cytochrome [Hyphomicrobium sp.]
MRWRIPAALGAVVAIAALVKRKPKEDAHHEVPRVFTATRVVCFSLVVALIIGAIWYARHDPEREAAQSHAIALLQRYGCAGCHTIPGVPRASGRVGPPLTGIDNRIYVGSADRNDPDALAHWIVDPPRSDPQTAMPRTGISLDEARQVVRYLRGR